MKTTRLIAFRLVLLLGWACLLACTTLLAVEQSGLAERWLRNALQDALESTGARIAIEHVSFEWLEPGVELRGVSISDRRELFRAERLHLTLGLTSGLQARLARVELERGKLLVGDSLSAIAASLSIDEADEPGQTDAAVLPVVQLRDFDVVLELGERGELQLARVDLSVDPGAAEAGGEYSDVATGRLTLPLAEGASEPARMHFIGQRRDARRIDWAARATDLLLESVRLPDGSDLEGLRGLAPHGRFDVDFEGTLDLDAPLELTGDMRLRARDVSVELRPNSEPIVEGTIDIAARLASNAELPPWHLQAWMAGARLSARWRGYGLRAGARIGSTARPGTLVETWARIPGLPVNEELVELFGHAPYVADPFEALKPKGEFDVTIGAHLLDSWSAPESLVPHLEYCVELKNSGRLSAEWLGIPPDPGNPRVAFPMPTDTRSARATYARTSRIPRPEFLGVHVVGDHASGSVDVRYCSWSPPIDLPPFSPKAQDNEAELRIRSDSIDVDPALHRALGGLAELPGVADVWDTYQPAGGHMSVELRLADRTQIPVGPVGHVHLELADCRATWSELPVPVHGIHGSIRYTTDGFGDSSVAFALEGATDTSPRVRIQGKLREEPDARPGSEQLDPTEGIALDLFGLDLQGSERAIVASTLPEVGDSLTAFSPSGRADVYYRRSRARRGGEATTRLEVRPSGELTLRPEAFAMPARRVRGRVVSETLERATDATGGDAPGAEAAAMTRIAPLLGEWPGGALVALEASFPAGAPARLELHGSGLSPSDAGFSSALLAALPAEWGRPDLAEFDTSRFGGALDFTTRIDAPLVEDEADVTHRLYFRRNDLELQAGERLRALDGDLQLVNERVTSDHLACALGSTRVEFAGSSATWSGGRLRVDTHISADGFRLDREHLRPFVEAATLEGLFDSTGLRGRLDLYGADLSYEQDAAGHTQLEVRGGFELTDVYADFGLPLAIGSAVGRIEELVIEDGNLRWLARLDDVYGRLLGRELGPASALATLQGSRLSLEEFEGSFARGTLRALDRNPAGGAARDRTGPVFSVDLAPPHAFDLGAELEDADVAVILKGLFPDGVASRGRFTTQLRLHGELDDLLSIRGEGYGEVLESRLWSIPVFRDLFSSLGLQANVVFDEMHTSFDVRDAVISMHEVEVRSPFLKLVGDGRLDLDGRLNFDFKVHYSALDKVRLVRDLVYLLQDSLLSVAIRGDMSRPIVLLRGSLSRIFRPVPDEFRHLPLPAYSRLPDRF